MKINQFEVWLVDFGDDEKCFKSHEQRYTRPFLVISNYNYNSTSKTPIGFILSTSEKKSQNDYTLPLTDKSHVNISQIKTISEERFIKKEDTNITPKDFQKIIKKFFHKVINGEYIKDVEILLNNNSDLLKNHFNKK